jgi:hypothetical protein
LLLSQLDRILGNVLAKHASLQSPDFHFRWEALKDRPDGRLVDEALTHFFLKDATDLNQDGCFVYLIQEGSNPGRMVKLSMVGRYAVLLRIGDRQPSLLEPS